MQDDFAALLRVALSSERLDAYRMASSEEDIELLARYSWNMALCEALYPALQCLEVALRNTIHAAVTAEFGNPYWFDSRRHVVTTFGRTSIEQAKRKLRSGGKLVEPGRMVAELKFGFWTSLLDAPYETILWRRHLRTAFPNMPRTLRKRKVRSTRLNRVRHLRNRVFHHEPLWHWLDLAQQHGELFETIRWISLALHNAAKTMDRFPDIYQAGHQPHRERLLQCIRNWP